MLRWCQSTVRALDGGGNSTLSSIRFRSSIAGRGPTRVSLGSGPTRAASKARMIERSHQPAVRPVASSSEFSRQLLVLGGPKDNKEKIVDGSLGPALVDNMNTSPEMSFSGRRDPLTELNHILRPGNLSPVSARTLKKLYALAKSRGLIRCLTSKQLTELLSLLGTVSLPAPRASCIYFSKLVSHIDESNFQTFWPFILEVARDKEKLGWKLDGTDRYWIMRAQLAKVVVGEDESLRSGDSRFHAVSVATEQYLRIRRHTPDPEVHLPYLQALFSLNSAKHVGALVRHLCSILESTPNPHSRFIDLFCHLLLKHGHSFTSQIKDYILSMVYTRLMKFGDVSVPSQKPTPPLSPRIFDNVYKPYKRGTLDTSDLRSALGVAVFPFASITEPPRHVRQWAHDEAVQTFALHLSQESRWDNIMLFAISRMPEVPVIGLTSINKHDTSTSGIGWKTVFVLATLHDTLATMNSTSLVDVRSSISNVVHPLWRMWKAENLGNPSVSTRVITSSFYRVAAVTADTFLKETCFQYCKSEGLFNIRDDTPPSESLQTQNLVMSHILAMVSCDGSSWPEIFSTLTPMFATTKARDEVIESLLWHYVSRDVKDTLRLYMFSRRSNVSLSVDVIHAVSISLASSHILEMAVPFLHHPLFSTRQTESLLRTILDVLRIERCRRINPTLADRIGQAMRKLYVHEAPSTRLKYPIRFFLPAFISSGHPAKAASLIELVYQQAPAFFTTRFFLRIIRTLVRQRELHLAAHIFHLIPQTPSRGFDDLRRKLTYMLDRAGSHNLARNIYRVGIPDKRWRTPREKLGRLTKFRPRLLAKRQPITFGPKKLIPLNGPTVKYAVSALVQARRSFAARKLFARSHHLLEAKTRTSVGNIILHGPLLHPDLRNERLIRHILRTKSLLEESCAFTPDGVTVNIILKAILRWKSVFDSPKIKALFDQIIRTGYPASPRWCRQHGVPFGTPLSPSQTFNLPPVDSTISFERHIRPMYKMFIKAFYLCHDVRAAKVVVGILKEEEVRITEEKEARDRARRSGLAEKQLRARELV